MRTLVRNQQAHIVTQAAERFAEQVRRWNVSVTRMLETETARLRVKGALQAGTNVPVLHFLTEHGTLTRDTLPTDI